MRLIVATDNRFLRGRDGNIYSTTVCDYDFWRRYLKVFDEVLVLARVTETAGDQLTKSPANGPNVAFVCLPTFVGPWQFLRHHREVNTLIKGMIGKADAFLLRAPGTVATVLWHAVQRGKIPYGVEVTGDPYDTLEQGTVESIFRPVLRRKMCRDLARQCRFACVSSYVTEFTLQKRYPPGGWTTHYSSIELPDEAIIGEDDFAAHLVSINDAITEKRPLKICHMGTMATLYKGQDVLLEAVHLCRKNGRKIELTLLGEGQYYQYYLNKAKGLHLTRHVSFLGQLPAGKAVTEQLDAADLFILPSLAEGLPRSLIEAMARGLPCLASNVGGTSELLADEYLFPKRDPAAIAKAIEPLFTDRSKFEIMASQNLKTARKYRADELNYRRKTMYQELKERSEEWHRGRK